MGHYALNMDFKVTQGAGLPTTPVSIHNCNALIFILPVDSLNSPLPKILKLLSWRPLKG